VNGAGGTVSVINTPTETVTNTIGVGSNPFRVAFHPDGTVAYVTNNGGTSVSVINTATETVMNTIGVGSFPTGIAFMPLKLAQGICSKNEFFPKLNFLISFHGYLLVEL